METAPKKDEQVTFEDSEVEKMDIILKSSDKLEARDDVEARKIQQTRIEEQSGLISILKQKADEMRLQTQILQKINTELEASYKLCQEELESERRKTEQMELRFQDLATNNTAIIAFMEEHKSLNAKLKLDNERLKSENESLFSQKLQEKEVCVQKLLQDIEHVTEKYSKIKTEYQQKLSDCQSHLLDQAAQFESKETLLLDQLSAAQQQHTNALELCEDLKLKLHWTKEQHALNETSMRESLESLSKQKDKLLGLSMERGKVIQDKQEEIQQLEVKWKEERKARLKAENRFDVEAEAVNKDVKVKSLQAALEQSMMTIEKLNMDFNAYKEHSASLLSQETELNKKLRHLSIATL